MGNVRSLSTWLKVFLHIMHTTIYGSVNNGVCVSTPIRTKFFTGEILFPPSSLDFLYAPILEILDISLVDGPQ